MKDALAGIVGIAIYAVGYHFIVRPMIEKILGRKLKWPWEK